MNNVDTAPSGTSPVMGLLEQLSERIARPIALLFQGSDDEDTRWDMAMSILRPSESEIEEMMTDLNEDEMPMERRKAG